MELVSKSESEHPSARQTSAMSKLGSLFHTRSSEGSTRWHMIITYATTRSYLTILTSSSYITYTFTSIDLPLRTTFILKQIQTQEILDLLSRTDIPLKNHPADIHNLQSNKMAPLYKDLSRLSFTLPIQTPVLHTREDLPAWTKHIRNTAELCGVWQYCNPEQTEEAYLIRRKALDTSSHPPGLSHLQGRLEPSGGIRNKDLDRIQLLVAESKKSEMELAHKKSALETIYQMILASASEWKKFVDKSSPYHQLVEFKNFMDGPSTDEMNRLYSEWSELQRLGQFPDVQKYLTHFKALYGACEELNLATRSTIEALGESLLMSFRDTWGRLEGQSWFTKDSGRPYTEKKETYSDFEEEETMEDEEAPYDEESDYVWSEEYFLYSADALSDRWEDPWPDL